MVAYKLFRKLKDGSITSLYINKKRKLPLNEWLEAESYPTKGYALRPYWHCVSNPDLVKHLSVKNRVWMKVEIDDYQKIQRPNNQGGIWYLAKKIKIINNEN